VGLAIWFTDSPMPSPRKAAKVGNAPPKSRKKALAPLVETAREESPAEDLAGNHSAKSEENVKFNVIIQLPRPCSNEASNCGELHAQEGPTVDPGVPAQPSIEESEAGMVPNGSVLSGVIEFIAKDDRALSGSTEETDSEEVRQAKVELKKMVASLGEQLPEAATPHWACLHCGEDNRAARVCCNNCTRSRIKEEPDEQKESASGTRADGHEASGEEPSIRVTPPVRKVVRAVAVAVDSAVQEKAQPEVTSPKAGKTHWTCSNCEEVNRAVRLKCNNCQHLKDEVAAKAHSPAKDRSSCTSSPYQSPWPSTERNMETDSKAEEGPNPWVEPDVCGAEVLPQEQVILHIYDVFADSTVQGINDVFRAVGTGAFHAGVEVFGQEWSYGYTPSDTGIVVCNPKENTCHRYREAIVMGTTSLSLLELEKLLTDMSEEWQGQNYDLLTRNCCHFSDALCRRLGVGAAPDWLTNLASAGARLWQGMSTATRAVNEMVAAVAERAAELDDQYKIVNSVDSFTNSEITFDEKYIENAVQNLWTQTVQKIDGVGKTIESAGVLAGRALDEVSHLEKTSGVKDVEAQIASRWNQWWIGSDKQHRYKALSHTTIEV